MGQFFNIIKSCLSRSLSWARDVLYRTPLALRRFYYAAFVCTILVSISNRPMVFETLNHLRFQYLLTGVLGLVFLRPLKAHFVSIGVLTIALNLAPVTYFYLPLPPSQNLNSNIRIMLSNVFQINDNYDSLSKLVRKENPDILVLQELTPDWEAGLGELLELYPYKVAKVLKGDFGIGVYSKWPIEKGTVLSFSKASPPSIVAEINHPKGTFGLVAAHPWPPITPRNFRRRNRQLHKIGEFVKQDAMPTIIVGDLNVTPLSPYFQELITSADLIDPRKGRGFLASCPTFLPPIWVPFDHILPESEFDIVDFRIGPYIGSDHWPIIADLHVPRSTD